MSVIADNYFVFGDYPFVPRSISARGKIALCVCNSRPRNTKRKESHNVGLFAYTVCYGGGNLKGIGKTERSLESRYEFLVERSLLFPRIFFVVLSVSVIKNRSDLADREYGVSNKEDTCAHGEPFKSKTTKYTDNTPHWE